MPKSLHVFAVGINHYKAFPDLQFCDRDAEALYDCISKRHANVTGAVLSSSRSFSVAQADLRSLLTQMESLGLGADDLVFFAFAGHGASSGGRDYLISSDTSRDAIENSVSTDEVIAALNSSGAGTTVLIIDACRSYVDRSLATFGERSAELARRKGVITFFGCSPGEICQEAQDLDGGHGVFTYALVEALAGTHAATPHYIDDAVGKHVEVLCKQHKFSTQTPYTTIAPLQKASVDLFSGQYINHATADRRQCILIVGPSNAGKSTIGQRLATQLGFTHVEMSSFAWQRYQSRQDYEGSIQDFMEDVVWANGEFHVIADDLIKESRDLQKLVVCGARRTEEIEALRSQDFDVAAFFIYANSKVRFTRHEEAAGKNRYALSYRDFVKKDMQEYGWGLAKTSSMRDVALEINEGTLEQSLNRIMKLIRSSPLRS
jgi:gluconate kinase